MFYLYCLPGKIIAQIGYLWPGRGQLWASGRRRESSFAHFFYATVFYGVVLWFFVLPRVNGQGSKSEVSAVVAPVAYVGPEEVRDSPEVDGDLGDEAPQDARAPETKHDDTATATGRQIALKIDSVRKRDERQKLLGISSAIDAMHRAFSSGKPERWREGKLRGYAVPSALNDGGCRTIEISSDKQEHQSVRAKICG